MNLYIELLASTIRMSVPLILACMAGLWSERSGIVDIGLVYEVNVDEESNVAMTYSLTSMGCPAGPHIAAEIERALREIPGVGTVKAELVWAPPWTPELMSEDAKFALGF